MPTELGLVGDWGMFVVLVVVVSFFFYLNVLSVGEYTKQRVAYVPPSNTSDGVLKRTLNVSGGLHTLTEDVAGHTLLNSVALGNMACTNEMYARGRTMAMPATSTSTRSASLRTYTHWPSSVSMVDTRHASEGLHENRAIMGRQQ